MNGATIQEGYMLHDTRNDLLHMVSAMSIHNQIDERHDSPVITLHLCSVVFGTAVVYRILYLFILFHSLV